MPVVFTKHIDEHTILSVWKIEETEQELLAGLQLKVHELDFIASLNSGKRLLHWLSTRLLLRTMLKTSDYIDMGLDDHGKPFLVNRDYHISLSHSFDYAAVMISKDKQVGVDIELVKEKVLRIKNKFMTDAELEGLQSANDINALYICWCAKEAIFKWYGRKGLEFKRDMVIQPFSAADQGSVETTVMLPEEQRELTVHYFKVDEAYMLGYVAAK
ncbi:MAG: 4'-phosphopantetheinyl transferase superfamily protein [Pedobacter sp.]|nr:MAG: 4'-phosphopantetheinyl transferase superfamily protein [Pedobacter sp.]